MINRLYVKEYRERKKKKEKKRFENIVLDNFNEKSIC